MKPTCICLCRNGNTKWASEVYQYFNHIISSTCYITFAAQMHNIYVTDRPPWRVLWQYRLWSFQTGYIKLEIFFPKNQHTQRKLLNFEIWISGEPSKSAKS